MKLVAVFASLLATAAAMPAEGKVSYDGYKVFRVPVMENDVPYLQSVIQRLNLSTWKAPKKGAFSDIQVAPNQLGAFERAMRGRSFEVMHEDLGASIADEGNFQAYAGKSCSPQSSFELSE